MRIGLPDATIEALQGLARAERRDVRGLVEHLVVRSMYRRGLVSRDGLERTHDAPPPSRQS
ncbi:MAG: hypothetical protein M3O91_01500 [Chloroflexota bacterium]|nr:hypothetical protein [Chloroflexota bacterium]